MNSYLRLPGAAAYLGISPHTLRQWVYRRLIKVYRPTRRCLLFKQFDLDKAMAQFASGGIEE